MVGFLTALRVVSMPNSKKYRDDLLASFSHLSDLTGSRDGQATLSGLRKKLGNLRSIPGYKKLMGDASEDWLRPR